MVSTRSRPVIWAIASIAFWHRFISTCWMSSHCGTVASAEIFFDQLDGNGRDLACREANKERTDCE